MRYEITREKYLSDVELAAFRVTLDKFESREPRNVCLLRLALETGARASELLSLTTSDFNHAEQSIYIHGLKRGCDRWLPLRPELFAQLVTLPVSADGRPFAFTYNTFREIWCLYRPCRKSLHSLRHTLAVNNYKLRKDVNLLKQILGHRSIQTTQVYMTYVSSMLELRQGMGV